MKKRSKSDSTFARQIAARFAEAIEAHDLTKDEAAEVLGVKRSAVYKYLSGNVIPGANVLRRASREWGITLDYRGLRVDYEYFKNSTRRPPAQMTQMELPFAPETLAGKNVRVNTRLDRSKRLQITLTIKVAG